MGCHKCGKCCIADENSYVGGTPETDAWLRMPNGECRYLLPPNKRGQRLCAIYKHPARPIQCDLYPNIPGVRLIEGCGFREQKKDAEGIAILERGG